MNKTTDQDTHILILGLLTSSVKTDKTQIYNELRFWLGTTFVVLADFERDVGQFQPHYPVQFFGLKGFL